MVKPHTGPFVSLASCERILPADVLRRVMFSVPTSLYPLFFSTRFELPGELQIYGHMSTDRCFPFGQDTDPRCVGGGSLLWREEGTFMRPLTMRAPTCSLQS
jgi:hypothetical protein